MHLNLPTRVVVGWLVKAALVLVTLSVTGQLAKFLLQDARLGSAIRFFDLNRERNLPTWYQGLTLLLCAALLWGIAGASKRAAAPYVGHWRGLSLIFAYLCCDELFKWHERSVEPLRAWLKVGGFLLYAWVVPALLLAAAAGIVYLRFLLHLPVPIRRRFLLAAALLVGGAVGMEMISGMPSTTRNSGKRRYEQSRYCCSKGPACG